MILQAFVGYMVKLFFQRPQIGGAANDSPVRHTKNKIAETEMIGHELLDLVEQHSRVFRQEKSPYFFCPAFVGNGVRLEQYGDILVRVPDSFSQLESGFPIDLAFTREFHVGYHTEHVVSIGLEVFPCFFVRAAMDDFGAGAHPQQLVSGVHALGDQLLGMLEYGRVNQGEV